MRPVYMCAFFISCNSNPLSFSLFAALCPYCLRCSCHSHRHHYIRALGCLVYELLVGHTPFQHDNQQEIFKRIIQSTRYLHFPKAVDSGAVDIVTKLLAANPAYRLGNLQVILIVGYRIV